MEGCTLGCSDCYGISSKYYQARDENLQELPERKLPCDDCKQSDRCDHQTNSVSGQSEDNFRLCNSLLMNTPLISNPLRLTGGGSTSSESQENNEIENQDFELFRKTPPIYSSPLRIEGRQNHSPFDSDSNFSMLLTPSIRDELPPCSENEIWWKSSPTLDLTPTVLNDITTPNISKSSISLSKELPETDAENLSESESTERIPLDAGYAITEIKEMMTLKRKHEQDRHVTCEKSKPQTHVFSQGKVYTYDKLDIKTSALQTNSKSKQSVISLRKDGSPRRSISMSELNPSATSFIPEVDDGAFTELKNIRIKNMKNVIIGQLNINSLRNKFELLAEVIKGNLDILIITETKLDHTFPEKQFLIPGYRKPYRRDRNRYGGGVMIYVREDIPCDILMKHSTPKNIEAIFLEINLRKNKLLLVGTYHSTNKEHGEGDVRYFQEMGLALYSMVTYNIHVP